MGDFPKQWTWMQDLAEGGQGHTYLVKRADGSDTLQYVLKRLKNAKRSDYFEREIEACEKLDHPNILKIVEHGTTPKDKPFLITPFCEGGSLDRQPRFGKPIEGLRFFVQICAGIAHAHESGVYHLDIKPANIFLRNETPVVGDFGICFIEDGEYVMTSEGPRGSMWYCAPELRGPKIAAGTPLQTADVYSLGKVLYWLFTHDVRDGHEEDYSQSPDSRLTNLFPTMAEFAFVDELIEGTVQRSPSQRIQKGFSTAVNLRDRVQVLIDRIEAGGRVLDLTTPIRCLFCGAGTYKALVDLPPLDKRLAKPDLTQLPSTWPDIYKGMRDAAATAFPPGVGGGVGAIGPLILICQHCGNVQHFRLDVAPEALKNWKP